MQVINQTSYLLVAAVVLVVVGALVWRLGTWPVRLVILGGVVGVLVASFLVLRSGSSQATSIDEVLVLTRGGVPVVVEVYSDF